MSDPDINGQLDQIRFDIREIKNYINGTSICAFAKSMDQPMQKISEAMTILAKQQNTNIEDVKHLKDTVFGNGKQGLDDKVQGLAEKMASLEKLAWIIVGALVATIIGVIWELILRHGADLIK